MEELPLAVQMKATISCHSEPLRTRVVRNLLVPILKSRSLDLARDDKQRRSQD